MLTSYISFCEDAWLPKKVIVSYRNVKLWLTKELRGLRAVKDHSDLVTGRRLGR